MCWNQASVVPARPVAEPAETGPITTFARQDPGITEPAVGISLSNATINEVNLRSIRYWTLVLLVVALWE